MDELSLWGAALVAVIGFWVAVTIVAMAGLQWLMFRKEHPVAFMGLLKFNVIGAVGGICLAILLSSVSLSLVGLLQNDPLPEALAYLLVTVPLVWALGMMGITAGADWVLKRGRWRRASKEVSFLTEPTLQHPLGTRHYTTSIAEDES